ncbi:MAG: flavodoxin family protein [Promethearchaeota archaeon]
MNSTHSFNVLVVLGSPRKNGNSTYLARELEKSINSNGGTVEEIYLNGLSIKPCNHCDVCKNNLDFHCVIKDDMQDLYPKLREADVIVLASPIYWFNYSAQLKLFIDRCYTNNYSEGYALSNKKIAIILTYGDNDLHTSGGINAIRSFEDAFRFVHSQIIGIVHGSAYKIGDAQKNTNLVKQASDLGNKICKSLIGNLK